MVNSAIKALKSSDPEFRKLIDRVGPCTLLENDNRAHRASSPFEALAESIAYQQLNGKAAATIWQRVLDIYGGKKLPKRQVILDTPIETLRAAGLSQNKVLALRDLAEKGDKIPSWKKLEDLSDERIIELLTIVRGIGPWTVQMLLIFKLGRPDVFPTTDYGVQKGFQLLYGRDALPTPKELTTEGERWRPYRSYAAWYLWRATELLKK